MADIRLIEPYKNYSGKTSKYSTIIHRTRNGRTHAYEIVHPNLRPHNEAQQAHTSLFGQVAAQVRAERQNPERLAYWEQRYLQYQREHKAELNNLKTADSNDLRKYSSRNKTVITSLFGFMFHEIYESAKSQQ